MTRFLNIKLAKKRIFGLDVLRSFAILFVLLEHGNNYLPEHLKQIIAPFIFDGVSLFFVLSGYLVGKILIKNIVNNNTDIQFFLTFIKRRWFKTLPNYYLILLVLLFLNFTFNSSISQNNTLSYFVFTQNFNAPHPVFFPEAWSLSIKEWFYLIIPLLLYISLKVLKLPIKKTLIIIILSILLLVTYYRFNIFQTGAITNYGDWDLMLRKQVLTRLDTIIYGVIGAFFHVYFPEIWRKYKNRFFSFGILLFIVSKLIGFFNFNPIDGWYQSIFSFSLTAFATLMTLPYLSNLKSGNRYLMRLFTSIILISYAMYLLNLSIVQFWIIDKIDWTFMKIGISSLGFIKYLIYWCLTFILSILLYKYFENPIMNLRDRKKKRLTN